MPVEEQGLRVSVRVVVTARWVAVLWLSACTAGPRAPLASAETRALASTAGENALPGTTDWLLTRLEPVVARERDERYRRQRAIEGYVSHASLRAGDLLTAYVSTQPAASYRAEVFRMGYYGGRGARQVAHLGPLEGVVQPEPVRGERQLTEARWAPSFEIRIPESWRSGVYLAKLTLIESGAQTYLIWVVRDDRRADLMFQVSDMTWQAYNRWPGAGSLYDWQGERWHGGVPSAKVGFDRPYGLYYNLLPATLSPLSQGSGEFLLWEYPLVYWLERWGYDVTYASNLDTHADGDGLLRVKGFLSVGHDEYWTRRMLDNVTRARDAGVSLAFLSGNSVDGEVTLEASSGRRENRVFSRSEGRGSSNEFDDEHLLLGATSYGVGLADWTVQTPGHWLFAGTGVAAGEAIPGLVGWEYHGPPLRDDPSLVVVASGKVFNTLGVEQTPGYAATLYQGPRGNVVFNAATCWWSLLLATPPGFVNPPRVDFARSDPRVQRMTKNLIERMIAPAQTPENAGR